MAHAQQQILDALKVVIVGGGTVAGDRVYVDRVDAVPPAKLPAILIDEAPAGETSEPFTIHGVDQRELFVTVRAMVSDGSSAAAEARELGLQIEKLVADPAAFRALAKKVRIESSCIVNDGKGAFLLSAREQTWRFTYLVRAKNPDILII